MIMAGWEDYSIDGTSFGKRFPGVVLHAFIYALHEKFLAIPVNFNPSLTPSTWRKTIQTEINRVLPYYVPYYEDEKRVQEWQNFLELHGFLDNKTEKQIQDFLENLCNTGILEVTPPGIFLASYAEMFYNLLNLMTGIRADKISYYFKINFHYTTSGENIYDEASEHFTDSGNVKDQPFNSSCFYQFGVGSYTMKRSPQYSLSAEHLSAQWTTTTNSEIVLKFINPTYSSKVRKFAYTIIGFFKGKNDYKKEKNMQLAWRGYKYPAWGGYKKIETDHSVVSTDKSINGYCDSKTSQILISTGLEYEGGNLNEDTNLPPNLDPYPMLVYTSESGRPPAPNGSEPFVKDSNGNWYMPPNVKSAWTSDEAYMYQHTKNPTKPIIYINPDFEFHTLSPS